MQGKRDICPEKPESKAAAERLQQRRCWLRAVAQREKYIRNAQGYSKDRSEQHAVHDLNDAMGHR